MDIKPDADGLMAPLRMKGINAIVYRTAWLLCAPIVYLYWRVSIHGKKNLKGLNGFILAPVHRSYVDPIVVGLALRKPVRPLAKEEFFQSKFAIIWKLMGGCPLRRGEADRNALKTAIAWINAGEQTIIFPEGTRKDGDKIEDIHEGVAYLAVKTKCPVIPVGIGGTEQAMPHGGKFIHPAKVTLEFGEPIYANPDLKMREATAELSERLKTEMQRCYDVARARLN